MSETVFTQTEFVVEEPTVPALWDPYYSESRNCTHRIINREQLEQLSQVLVREIARGNDCTLSNYTGVGTVFSELIRRIEGGIEALSRMGVRRAEDIKYLKDHCHLIQNVNASMWAFVRARPVVTLYEADLLLRKLCYNYELILGPLLKLPVIIEIFNPSANTRLPPMQLTCFDIVQDLINWTPNRMWRTFGYNSNQSNSDDPSYQAHNFERFLCTKYGTACIEDLGVRIRSFSVLVHTSFMCVKDYTIRNIEKKCEKQLAETIGSAYFDFKRNLDSILPLTNRPAVLKEYLRMNSQDLLTAVFNKYSELGEALRKYHTIGNPTVNEYGPFKHVKKLLSDLLQPECLAVRHMFCLALCSSRLEVDEITNKWANLPVLTARESDSDDECEVVGVSGTSENRDKRPNQDQDIYIDLSNEEDVVEVTGSSSQPAENVLMTALASKISSSDRMSCEELKKFVTTAEECLHNWSQLLKSECKEFLEFIITHASSLGVHLSDCGTSNNSESKSEASAPCISSDQVSNLLCSISNLATIDSTHLCRLVVQFFNLDSKYLSVDQDKLLALLHQCQKSIQDNSSAESCVVVHEESLCNKRLSDVPSRLTQNCVHSLENVLSMMANCPPLTSIQSYMQWDLVYRPFWGDLNSFLNKNAVQVSGKDVLVLRSNGHLIRLFSHPTIEGLSTEMLRLSQIISESRQAGAEQPSLDFKSVLNIAGVLVSLIVINRGSDSNNVLLAELLEESLQQWRHRGLSTVEFVAFTQLMISVMPPLTCSSFIKQVLLPCVHRTINCSIAPATVKFPSFLHQLTYFPVKDITHCDVMNVSSNTLGGVSTCQSLITNCYTIGLLENIEEWIDCFRQPSDRSLGEVDMTAPSPPVVMEMQAHVDDTNDHVEIDVPAVESDADSSDRKSLVETIRRSEFGIGLEMSSETRQVLECYQSRLTRSLGHLSEDLYSRHCHFMLELIQNADDNRYDKGTAEPTIEFHSFNHQLLVLNNEQGFIESDIRALCDIGKSTKVGDKIGRKGIGFKSVFLVSDQPRIHSKSFHVRFLQFNTTEDDRCKKNRGGIVPEWIETPEPDVVSRAGLWNTQIVLPLRENEAGIREDIEKGLSQTIEPRLLLFLRKIKCIRAITSLKETIVKRLEEDDPNVISISNGETVFSWFVHHSVLACDSALKKLRPNPCSSTTVSIAIPLSTTIKENQSVFAYLPLRSFGLKFIVNCDFDIPASREDISEDSPWNLWLLQQIPHVFAHLIKKAVILYHNRSVLKTRSATIHPEDLLKRIFSCVPLPLEVDTQFRDVATKIRSQISQIACLPDIEGNLRPPSKLLLPEAYSKNIINNKDEKKFDLPSRLLNLLKNRCGINTLSDKFLESDVPPEDVDNATANYSMRLELEHRKLNVLSHLGCQPLGLQRWLELAASLTDEDKTKMIGLVRDLLCTIESYLIDLPPGECHRAVTSLQNLPLLPLRGEKVGTPSLQPDQIFIWTEDCGLKLDELNSDMMADVSIVNPLLHNDGCKLDVKLKILSLLNRLGVEVLTRDSLLNKLILPRVETLSQALSLTDKDQDWIISTTRFIFTNYSQMKLKEISDRLPVLVYTHYLEDHQSDKLRLVFPNRSKIEDGSVYFSRSFLSNNNLPPGIIQPHMVNLFEHFKSAKCYIVSDIYLCNTGESLDINRSIVRGLQSLGVTDIPQIHSRKTSFTLSSLDDVKLSKLLYDWMKVFLDQVKDKIGRSILDQVKICIEDFEIPELKLFVAGNIFSDDRWQAMNEVVHLLLNNWSLWSLHTRVNIKVSSEDDRTTEDLNHLLRQREMPASQWIAILRENSWLPCQFVDKEELKRPVDVYPSPEFMKFGSLEVNCLLLCRPSVNITNRAVVDALSLKKEITAADLQEILRSLLNCDCSKLTLRAMKSLYTALQTSHSKEELRNLFQGEYRYVFLPHENPCRNSFQTFAHLYWQNLTLNNNLKMHNIVAETIDLDSHRQACLSKLYGSGLESLFVDALKISRYPPLTGILPVTRQIHNSARPLPSSVDAEEDLFRNLVTWYHLLSVYMVEESQPQTSACHSPYLVKKICRDRTILLCEDGEWRPFNRENIFAYNSLEYRDLLRDNFVDVFFLAYGVRFIDLHNYHTCESAANLPVWEVRGERRDACDFLFSKLEVLILDDLVQEKIVESESFVESEKLVRFFTPLMSLATTWFSKQLSNFQKPEIKHRIKNADNKIRQLKFFLEGESLDVDFDFGPVQKRFRRSLVCRCLNDTLYVNSKSVFVRTEETDSEINYSSIIKELARFLFGDQHSLTKHFSEFLRGFLDTVNYKTDVRVLNVFLSSHGLRMKDLPQEYRPPPPPPIVSSNSSSMHRENTLCRSPHVVVESADERHSRKRPAPFDSEEFSSRSSQAVVIPGPASSSIQAESDRAMGFQFESLFNASTSRSRPLPGKILRLGTDSGSRVPIAFPQVIASPVVNLRTTETTDARDRSLWTPLPPGRTATPTAQALGMWGEEVVYHHLKNSTKLGDIDIVSVHWLNETDGSSVAPYDIVVKLQSPWLKSEREDDHQRPGAVSTDKSHNVYIEVKTTFDKKKRDFDISVNQIEFACNQRERFHLFRVFNAQDPDNLIIDHVPDLYNQMFSKKILLKMLI